MPATETEIDDNVEPVDHRYEAYGPPASNVPVVVPQIGVEVMVGVRLVAVPIV